MLLQELVIQNFRSYGNNKNILTFDTDKGNLILIAAPNGGGKSSMINSIDFAVYGKVKGSSGKNIKLASLPNRINKNLVTGLKFRSYDTDVRIDRRLQPSKFEVYENEQPVRVSGSENKQKVIDRYVEFDLDGWKSFISMSVNNFKNFMSLKAEEKRILLDKLFNLEMINIVTKVLKDKKKGYTESMKVFNAEIESYRLSVTRFAESIEKLKVLNKKEDDDIISKLKEKIESEKDNFSKLKRKLDQCRQKKEYVDRKISKIDSQVIGLNHTLAEIKKKVALYDKRQCPTCGSDFDSELFDGIRSELVENLSKNQQLLDIQTEEKEEMLKNKKKLSDIERDTEKSYQELRDQLMTAKNKIKDLSAKHENQDNNSVDEVMNTIKEIESKMKESIKEYDKAGEELDLIDEMLNMFSDDGFKKTIISNIIKPVNQFIYENLKQLDLPFKIELDDTFTAKITLMGEEIDTETLSTGELKKCNISVMLAYIKLIRLRKHINILFLDEIFSSIDIEGVSVILKMFKSFADEYKINVFLIHHAMLDKSYFDKVIRMEKNVTSDIIIEK